jgi:hypothetical protein
LQQFFINLALSDLSYDDTASNVPKRKRIWKSSY